MVLISKKAITLSIFLLGLLSLTLILPTQSIAADTKDTEILELKERVIELEKNQSEHYHTLEEKKSPGLMSPISEWLSIGGLIEVEAFSIDDDRMAPDGGSSSDIVLATVEVFLEAKIHDYVRGEILLLWEEDDTEEVVVDEGKIIIGKDKGLSLTLGKLYVPFGVYNSHFISNPFTLELGETRESAAILAYANQYFSLSLGAFNGDIDKTGDDHVEDFVAALNIAPAQWLSFGVSYITDIAESDADITGGIVTTDNVEGISAFLSLTLGPVTLDTEYLAALDDFELADYDDLADGKKDKPETYNIELAVAIGEKIEIATRYEGSSDISMLPEEQYGVAVSYALFDHVTIAFEVLHGEFQTNEDVDSATAQIAIEF
jgi:hypothetical protein